MALWNEAKAELGYTPDLFLPMTHQLIHEDKATAVALSKHDELAKCTPFLLAGHEHDMYVDEAGRSTIVKVGSDAERIGVCDVWWNAQGKVQSRCVVLLVRIRSRARVPKVCQVAARLLQSMMSAPIATVKEPMSSKKVRHEPSGVASFLLGYVQKALHKEGVDLAMVQGGFVRAKKDYDPGAFRMGDLFGEVLAFSPTCPAP